MKQRDNTQGAVAAALESSVANSRLAVVTYATLKKLAAELKADTSAAVKLIYSLAEKYDRPIGLNYPTGKNTTRTAFLPPPGWSTERLSGYVAGQHKHLEATLGVVSRVSTGTGLV